MTDRYNVSKLLEVLSCREIARHHPNSQMKVTLNFVSKCRVKLGPESTSELIFILGLDPGWCHSELLREMTNPMITLMKKLFCRTTEVGSRTLVHAGVAGPETHGQYLSDCKVTPCAPLVEGKQGAEMQRRAWEELAAKLEEIEPGVLKVLDA